jgi:hypothetical protein
MAPTANSSLRRVTVSLQVKRVIDSLQIKVTASHSRVRVMARLLVKVSANPLLLALVLTLLSWVSRLVASTYRHRRVGMIPTQIHFNLTIEI